MRFLFILAGLLATLGSCSVLQEIAPGPKPMAMAIVAPPPPAHAANKTALAPSSPTRRMKLVIIGLRTSCTRPSRPLADDTPAAAEWITLGLCPAALSGA